MWRSDACCVLNESVRKHGVLNWFDFCAILTAIGGGGVLCGEAALVTI